jgi:acyl carrier protein
MLPALIRQLPEMPLTANGKVDRQLLKQITIADDEFDSSQREFTALEEMIAALWSDVLHVERVSLESNFFDLGGHSLLGMQLIGRIKELLGIEITLRVLFEAPTLNQLAAALLNHESRSGQTNKIAETWRKINSLTPTETKQMLDQQSNHKS